MLALSSIGVALIAFAVIALLGGLAVILAAATKDMPEPPRKTVQDILEKRRKR